MRQRICFFILCLTLISCAPTSIKELKDTGVNYSFLAEENYQSVYRKIFEKEIECKFHNSLDVTGNLYTDIKKGEIILTVRSPGRGMHFYIEIKAMNENKTQISIYSSSAFFGKNANVIEKWVIENYEQCDL
jgi:hypothetical protein